MKMNKDRAEELLVPLRNGTAENISAEWPKRLIEALEYVIETSPRLEQVEQENMDLRAAMQWFVDRVERGEVRSVRTYELFKKLLGNDKEASE